MPEEKDEKCKESKICIDCRFFVKNKTMKRECGVNIDPCLRRSIEKLNICPFRESALTERRKIPQCSDKTCGDCDYYKYYAMCGMGCHLTPETGVIRKGPITKNCPYKVKISKKEQDKRAHWYKRLAKYD